MTAKALERIRSNRRVRHDTEMFADELATVYRHVDQLERMLLEREYDLAMRDLRIKTLRMMLEFHARQTFLLTEAKLVAGRESA